MPARLAQDSSKYILVTQQLLPHTIRGPVAEINSERADDEKSRRIAWQGSKRSHHRSAPQYFARDTYIIFI